MESLLTHLLHAALVIWPGRLYLHQLFALLPLALDPHQNVRLNLSVWVNLTWWDVLLHNWNGVSLFPPWTPSVHLFFDASGSFGSGASDPSGTCFSVRWQHWFENNIAAKELVPLVLGARLWGAEWRGCHVLFHVHIVVMVASVRRLNVTDHLLCQFLCCLQFFSAHFGFTFTTTHIPGI